MSNKEENEMKKILSVVLCMAMMLGVFVVAPIGVSATQSRSYNFSTNYTLTGNPALDIVAIAQAQNGKTQGQLGYTEAWCADFVGDCALLAGQSSAVPTHGAVSSLYSNVINAGGWIVSSPQTGDLAFYKDSYGFCHAGIMVDSLYMISGNMWTSGSSKVETWKYTQYNSGSYVSVTFVKPNYISSGPHTHSYDTFVHYWPAHPHYNCYKCSCGEVKERLNETMFISSCDECNAQITQIPEDTYYIRNKADNLYMSVFNAGDTDRNTIHNYDFSYHNAQAFTIYPVSDGYEIMPVCSSTRVVNAYCWEVVSGETVNLMPKCYDGTQWWKFQAVNGGYVIRNVLNPNVCITPIGESSMAVSEYTGADNQIWYLEKVCTVAYDGNGGANVPTSHITRAGYDVTLSTQTPTKDGYMFLGWSTDKNATEATYNAGATTKFTDSTTLYAVWEKDVILPTIGNVDNNDTIDATDALQILQAIVGKTTFTDAQKTAADVDGNGEINATDALLILQRVVGKITKFPVEG